MTFGRRRGALERVIRAGRAFGSHIEHFQNFLLNATHAIQCCVVKNFDFSIIIPPKSVQIQ
jgi:hypothetical protein